MKRFIAEFKDDKDRIILILMLIGSLFTFCLPSVIIVFLLKDFVSESTYNISKAFFNFELLLLLITLAFAIPVIGWMLGLIFGTALVLFNIIIIAIDLYAISAKKEIIVPVLFEFL